MVQLSIFDYEIDTDWKGEINCLLQTICHEQGLYEDAVYLSENLSRDKSKVMSYTVCIWEKDYPEYVNSHAVPEKNGWALKITENKWKNEPDILRVDIKEDCAARLKFPENIVLEYPKAAGPFFRINKDDPMLVVLARMLVEDSLEAYESKASGFGCCSRFKECSKKKDCVHPNRLFSKGCMYRKNLNAGNVFYGDGKEK